jgi:predicted nucleotidyltransferase
MADLNLLIVSEQLRELLPELGVKYGVGRLWVFGSFARGEAGPDSDLDVLVEFERRGISLFGFVGLEQEISDRLGLKVDLVERSALRPEIRPEVLAEAQAVTLCETPFAASLFWS